MLTQAVQKINKTLLRATFPLTPHPFLDRPPTPEKSEKNNGKVNMFGPRFFDLVQDYHKVMHHTIKIMAIEKYIYL